MVCAYVPLWLVFVLYSCVCGYERVYHLFVHSYSYIMDVYPHYTPL